MGNLALALFLLIFSVFSVTNYALCAITPDSDGHVVIPATAEWEVVRDYSFAGCASLKSVSWGEGNQVTKKIGRYAFQRSVNLESIALPASLTWIDSYAFYGCTKLTTIQIPSGVTQIGQAAFKNCEDLTSISIPASVEDMGNYTFQSSGLETVSFDGASQLKSIGKYSFSSTNLASFTVPDNVVSINLGAFYRITTLREIVFASDKNLKFIGVKAFASTFLESLNLPSSVTHLGMEACMQCRALKTLSLGTSLRSIGSRAFYQSHRGPTFENVTIPATVESIGDFSFSRNTGLVSVIIETDSSGASSLTSMGSKSFYDCIKLSSIAIPRTVTSIGEGAFWNCVEMTHATIHVASQLPALPADIFRKCIELQNFIPPQSVRSIGDRAFDSCTALQSITLPGGLTELGNSAFEDCIGLNNSITIPSSVTHLGSSAFKGCTKLARVDLSPSISTLGNESFYGTALTSVAIPASVRFIGDRSFSQCMSLATVTIGEGASLDVGDAAFKSAPITTLDVGTTTSIRFYSSELTEMTFKSLRFRKSLTNITNSPLPVYACSNGVCGCKAGSGNTLPSSSLSFTCAPCAIGLHQQGLTIGTCSKCSPGTYAAVEGQGQCSLCQAGMYSTARGSVSSKDCKACHPGDYSGQPGASRCRPCPPGSQCSEPGMTNYQECEEGHYTNSSGQIECFRCPPGRYQHSSGAALCHACPLGKFYGRDGANSSSFCLPCLAGTYGDKAGLSQCTRCPTGQVQPDQGQDSCKECTLEGKIKTNNAARTECIDNQALLSTSMVEIMFKKGVALIVSFVVAGAFVSIASVTHYLKLKYNQGGQGDHELGSLLVQQTAMKSGLPGFSFGSELVLIMGMWQEAPGLATSMLVFRLLHLVTALGIFVVFILPTTRTSELLRSKFHNAEMNPDFMMRHIPLVSVLSIATMCDCTMIQFFPWAQSRFYQMSHGMPSLSMLRLCLGIKTMQALVSVVCQSAYLNRKSALDDPTASTQAKILFGLSIALSCVSLTMGMMMLFFKGALLSRVDEEEMQQGPQLEMNDLYGGAGAAEGSLQGNPMHSVLSELQAEAVGHRETIRAQRDQIASLESQVRSLGLRSGSATASNAPLEAAERGESSCTAVESQGGNAEAEAEGDIDQRL